MDKVRNIHPSYEAAKDAIAIIPEAVRQLEQLKSCFSAADEDFLAVEMKIMIARMLEIEDILLHGDKG